MGNTQPTNKTGKKATAQKLENAKKLGILSLTEHSLETIPKEVLTEPDLVSKLRTLDLSKNKLSTLDSRLCSLQSLKSINLDDNKLSSSSDLTPLSSLPKLENLSIANNSLGKAVRQAPKQQQQQDQQKPPQAAGELPFLPTSLKQLNLSRNALSHVPGSIVSGELKKLEKLDLSDNQLATVPTEITSLVNLQELNLDGNTIVSLPVVMSELRKLKVLSLRYNQITVPSSALSQTGCVKFTENNPQPLPKEIFTDTPLIDLNLHGNHMTNTQLNQFEGFDDFLERRQKASTMVAGIL